MYFFPTSTAQELMDVKMERSAVSQSYSRYYGSEGGHGDGGGNGVGGAPRHHHQPFDEH